MGDRLREAADPRHCFRLYKRALIYLPAGRERSTSKSMSFMDRSAVQVILPFAGVVHEPNLWCWSSRFRLPASRLPALAGWPDFQSGPVVVREWPYRVTLESR